MLKIHARIDVCDDGKHRERKGMIQGITCHMFGVPGVHDAAGIARFYRMQPEWTGGQMPYSFVVHPSGCIEQALPLGEVGPHALRWSDVTIGVVHIGDFNRHPVPQTQWQASVELVAELCCAFGLQPSRPSTAPYEVAGHTERPHATRSPDKVCPGRLWGMYAYREAVELEMREAAVQRLVAAGAAS